MKLPAYLLVMLLLISLIVLGLAGCKGKSTQRSVGTAPVGTAPVGPAPVEPAPIPPIIFVHPAGSNANTGDQANPFLTIQAAVLEAGVRGGKWDVKVAAGNYTTDSLNADPTLGRIVLSEGISLLGGYDPADWNVRDPAVHVSAITEISSDTANPSGPVKVVDGVTTATLIEGFTIRGNDTTTSTAWGAAITLDGTLTPTSSPTIRNNILIAGCGANTGISSAIWNQGGSPIVEGNTLYGTDNPACWATRVYGYYQDAGGSAIVRNNPDIRPLGVSGAAQTGCTGLCEVAGVYFARGDQPLAEGNTINIPTAPKEAHGIAFFNAGAVPTYHGTATGNTITLGTSVLTQKGIYASFGAAPNNKGTVTINNNVITMGTGTGTQASAYGIFVAANNSLTTIESNTIKTTTPTAGIVPVQYSGIYFTASTGDALIRGNVVRVGNSTGTLYGSVGLHILASNMPLATISDNLFVANSQLGATGATWGVLINGAKDLNIFNNKIHGGSAPTTTYGAYFVNISGTANFYNNLVYGGVATTNSYGVYFTAGTVTGSMVVRLYNNTVDSGTGGTTNRGIYLNAPFTTMEIVNNILKLNAGTTVWGVQTMTAALKPPTRMDNNSFSGGGVTSIYSEANAPLAGSYSVATMPVGFLNNVADAPVFVSPGGTDGLVSTPADNDWHLGATTPVTVTGGGATLPAPFDVDMAGVTRTAPWSMGAYEF
ncbi:MAG: right-handed parallel beta-helix repeat-containing protein [Deltaproteobacteria bacterium]|nr:right-handed parallel beta-helix repeat-containing protein [Deltaproteobacteria bacterium]